MENAIAAVKTGKVNTFAASKHFKVSDTTLRRRLAETGTVHQVVNDATLAKPSPISAEERDEWWADHQAGLSARKMAEKYGRGRRTITDEIKRREDQPQSTVAPEWFRKGQPPAQAERSDRGQSPHNPEPSIQPDPISGMLPRQPGMPLPQLSKDIISRERKAATKRTARLASLVELDTEMTALWKFAQKRFGADGRSVLRNHMSLADEAMVADGMISSACTALGISPEASYEEMLWAIDATAKRVSQSARQAIYLFGYRDGMPE